MLLPMLAHEVPAGPAIYGYADAEWHHWENATLFPWDPMVAYRPVEDGEMGRVLRADSKAAASMIRRQVTIDLSRTPRLTWAWKVAGRIAGADESVRRTDDAPARVYVFWNLHHRNDLVRAQGLGYVWGQRLPAGTVQPDPDSPRIGIFVLRSVADGVGVWRRESRNLLEDFRAYFKREPAGPVTLVSLLTDTDQTGQRATAWYGPIEAGR